MSFRKGTFDGLVRGARPLMLRIWNVLRADGSLSTRLGSGDVLPGLDVASDSTSIAVLVADLVDPDKAFDGDCLVGR